jgi:hypothetical protein
MGYEQLQGFCKYRAGHCKDGVEQVVYMSNAVLIGYMDGQKDEERNESFGNGEDTVKRINVAT